MTCIIPWQRCCSGHAACTCLRSRQTHHAQSDALPLTTLSSNSLLRRDCRRSKRPTSLFWRSAGARHLGKLGMGNVWLMFRGNLHHASGKPAWLRHTVAGASTVRDQSCTILQTRTRATRRHPHKDRPGTCGMRSFPIRLIYECAE